MKQEDSDFHTGWTTFSTTVSVNWIASLYYILFHCFLLFIKRFRASACKFLNSVMKMKVAFSLVYKIVSFNQLLICSLMFHEK
jgi:hypothetical protein